MHYSGLCRVFLSVLFVCVCVCVYVCVCVCVCVCVGLYVCVVCYCLFACFCQQNRFTVFFCFVWSHRFYRLFVCLSVCLYVASGTEHNHCLR